MDLLSTYASLVNSRSKMTKRTQSLTKISSLGLGVIYYWHWGWASVPVEQAGRYKKSDLELASKGRAPAGFKTSGDVNEDSLYGRFMYLGLTVQNPTMVRMEAHLQDAVNSGGAGPNSKANALYQAITQSETSYGQEGIIQKPQEIPNVIHLVSWFDLDALESYYIVNKYQLTNSPAKTFSQQIQGGNFASGVGDQITRGVNTAGGGQGGTFKQTNDRGPAEWISAAYYFLQEQDADVLSARSAAGLSEIARKANQEPTLPEKILAVFKGFISKEVKSSSSSTGKSTLLAPQVIKMMSNYDLTTIKTYLDIVGFKDNQKFQKVKSDKYLSDEEIKKQLDEGGFSTYEFMNEYGKMLDVMVSYDVNNHTDKSILKFRSSASGKKVVVKGLKEVKTELRTAIINSLIKFDSMKQQFIANGETIRENLSISFEEGLNAADEVISLLRNRHEQLSKQNQQLSAGYVNTYNKLEAARKGLAEEIRKTIEEVRKESEALFKEAGASSYIESVVDFLLIAPKKVGMTPSAGGTLTGMSQEANRAAARKLKNKFKDPNKNNFNDKRAKKIVAALGKVYNKFSALQSLMGKIDSLGKEEIENILKKIKEPVDKP